MDIFCIFGIIEPMKSLSSSDREFFSRVQTSALLNPFSEERLSSDASAVGMTQPPRDFSQLGELLDKLDRRLRAALGEGGASLREYVADDAALLEPGLLFLLFHRHREGLDRYIKAQSGQHGDPLPADCGAAIFADLRLRGLSVARAERFVAVFFQLRRAFYFIAKGLVGDCASMRALRVQLWNAVFTSDSRLYLETLWNRMEDFSTLLLGETGTGKGAAAMALGRSNYIPYVSSRRAFAENFDNAFLSINLSEFSEGLIESELFGHKKGAFTGAVGDHAGIFSRCSRHGAIFLDEIGDVSERVQIKLLQVLQQRVFSPVGGHEKLRFSGRIIAATNQDLSRRRAGGGFRNDFYYRLSSSHIELPTLRQRLAENEGELNLLLAEVVRRLLGEDNAELAGRIEEALRRDLPPDYAWPGNVRELEQAARSVILTGGYAAEAAAPTGAAKDPQLARCLAGEMRLGELEAWYCGRLYDRLGSYGAVAARLGVDWRTVRQKIESARGRKPATL